jgi:hypothetical protein
MEIIQPWQIKVARINIAEHVDLEGLAGEIHQLHCASPRESKTPYIVTPEEFPLICEARDGIITEKAKEFIKEAFGVDPLELAIDTFGKWFQKGEALGGHLHGNSCVTSVFYPYEYGTGMTLQDPRLNAQRGYSRRIRDNHFGDVYVQPKAGDLWLVPSYVPHYVPTVKDDLRISLINDFHFV